MHALIAEQNVARALSFETLLSLELSESLEPVLDK
jgi:hypothetical protein